MGAYWNRIWFNDTFRLWRRNVLCNAFMLQHYSSRAREWKKRVRVGLLNITWCKLIFFSFLFQCYYFFLAKGERRQVEWTRRIFIQYEGLAFEKLKIHFKDFFTQLTRHRLSTYYSLRSLFLSLSLSYSFIFANFMDSWSFALSQLNMRVSYINYFALLTILRSFFQSWLAVFFLLVNVFFVDEYEQEVWSALFKCQKFFWWKNLSTPNIEELEKCNTKSEWTESRFFSFRRRCLEHDFLHVHVGLCWSINIAILQNWRSCYWSCFEVETF